MLLPTGEVFVCGGMRGEEGVDGDGNTFFRYSDSTAVREGEIYSPGIDWDNGVRRRGRLVVEQPAHRIAPQWNPEPG